MKTSFSRTRDHRLVDVLIPTLNRVGNVTGLVEHYSQQYKSGQWRLFFSDNHSTDGTHHYLESQQTPQTDWLLVLRPHAPLSAQAQYTFLIESSDAEWVLLSGDKYIVDLSWVTEQVLGDVTSDVILLKSRDAIPAKKHFSLSSCVAAYCFRRKSITSDDLALANATMYPHVLLALRLWHRSGITPFVTNHKYWTQPAANNTRNWSYGSGALAISIDEWERLSKFTEGLDLEWCKYGAFDEASFLAPRRLFSLRRRGELNFRSLWDYRDLFWRSNQSLTKKFLLLLVMMLPGSL